MASIAGAARRRLTIDGTVFLLCDIQERFRSVIWQFPGLVHTSGFLVQTGRTLGIPLIVTEQYPKAFKNTVAELQSAWSAVPGAPAAAAAGAGGEGGEKAAASTSSSAGGAVEGVHVFEKTKFSMITPEVSAVLSEKSPSSAVIFGLETHVCVQQTALELLAQGIDVHVVVDAVSSQRVLDRKVALDQLKQAGAVLTTAESLVMTLLGDSKHPQFKAVAGLLRVSMLSSRNPSLLWVLWSLGGPAHALYARRVVCWGFVFLTPATPTSPMRIPRPTTTPSRMCHGKMRQSARRSLQKCEETKFCSNEPERPGRQNRAG